MYVLIRKPQKSVQSQNDYIYIEKKKYKRKSKPNGHTEHGRQETKRKIAQQLYIYVGWWYLTSSLIERLDPGGMAPPIASSQSSAAAGCSVRVAVRVRPLLSFEKTERLGECVGCIPNSTQLYVGHGSGGGAGENGRNTFTFDFTFPKHCEQRMLYDDCVASLLEGERAFELWCLCGFVRRWLLAVDVSRAYFRNVPREMVSHLDPVSWILRSIIIRKASRPMCDFVHVSHAA